ncbi:hypothetical protein C9374_012737 [Naegleria lovaniensis]|uniref:DUF4116 domain-containing protein n=1 Tax=Naegleria lovaniensis TaxID=51637 RepID=A0AA88KWD8_NAELO|nr:uncharacterized protein C9374_012737 [Naegleria lovaniensis]KAG2392485.1 hypothetical protein C9374_012737 [Naegleria lovaniensis]
MLSPNTIRKTRNESDVYQIVSENGRSLHHVTGTLKDNKNIALAAMENDLYAFLYISNRLKQDPEIITYVLERIFQLLTSGSSEQTDFVQKKLLPSLDRSCKTLLQQLMKRDGLLFQHLRGKFLACTSLAILAVKQNPRAIHFVSKPIFDYKTLAKLAIEGDYYVALELVDKRAWENEKIVSKAFMLKNKLRRCEKFLDICIISFEEVEGW